MPLRVCYLHLPLPKVYSWDYLAKESDAWITLERQDPVQGWARRVMLVFNPFVLVSDPTCISLLFPEEPGKQLLSSQHLLGLPQLEGEVGVSRGLGFSLWTPRAPKAKQTEGKSPEGVEVQQEIIYTDTGKWKSQEVSYHSIGQQFWPSEKSR